MCKRCKDQDQGCARAPPAQAAVHAHAHATHTHKHPHTHTHRHGLVLLFPMLLIPVLSHCRDDDFCIGSRGENQQAKQWLTTVAPIMIILVLVVARHLQGRSFSSTTILTTAATTTTTTATPPWGQILREKATWTQRREITTKPKCML